MRFLHLIFSLLLGGPRLWVAWTLSPHRPLLPSWDPCTCIKAKIDYGALLGFNTTKKIKQKNREELIPKSDNA